MTQIYRDPQTGEEHEFPDDATPQEIDEATKSTYSSQQNEPKKNNGIFNLGGGPPSDRSVIDVFIDLGAGLARGSQNLASAGLEAGEYLTRKGAERLGRDLGHSVKVPYWNAREFMGLEGSNKIDLGGMIQGSRPDQLSQAIGQFGPSIAAGGPNALRQILTQAGYGASQASPDEQNALGLLPSGRGGAAIMGGATGALPFAIPKVIGRTVSAFNKYFRPEKTAKEFISQMGGGKTITENIKELGKRLEYGQGTVKEEALTPKREIMAEKGEERTFPSQKKPEEHAFNVGSVFGDVEDLSKQEMSKFKKAVKTYHEGDYSHKNPDMHIEPGDIDTLIEKGEEIFGHKGLEKNDLLKLDEALIPEQSVKGEYLKIKNPDEHYRSELLQDAHDSYAKNPTFRNSDKLRSRLFKRINELNKEKTRTGSLSDAKDKELESLTRNRNAIIEDQDKLIETFSPENKEKYGKFNKLWREDQRAYEDAGATIKNLKNGFLNNVTPQNITKAFSFPELKPQVQKVLKDIGPSGVNNIVYNELGRAKGAVDALKILEGLERNKGFAPYLTPEIRQFSQRLRTQLRNKRIAKIGGGAVGLGALGEAGYKIGQNIFGR